MPAHQPVNDGFPRLSMQPISVDFIENRDAGFRNAQGELPCEFDPDRQRFVARPGALNPALQGYEEELRESNLRLVATTESFSAALTALKKRKSKDEKIASFDLDSCHDWNEISELIQVVVRNYHKDDTAWGNVRSAFRRVGDNAKSIQCFVGLLPDGEYKTLCGGLTLILTAMAQHSEVREKMADLLQEVPEVVKQCEQYQTLYPGHNTIQLCVNDIYTNLLIALEAILEWYKQSSWKHAADSLRKNSNYGYKIDQCLKNIRQSKSRFMEETQLYLAWSQQATFSTALKTNYQSREINSNVLGVGERVGEVQTTLQNAMKTYGSGLDALRESLDDVIKNAIWAGDVKRLAEDLMQERLNNANDKQRILELEEQVAKTTITPEYLIRELRLNQAKHTHVPEISMVLKYGLNSSAKFQNRAGWVGNTTEFRNWLGGPDKSRMLVIQGHGEFGKTSPLSFLISLLYEKLEKAPHTLVLPFFCGRSTVSSGPVHMVRALFIQLLALCDTYTYDRERGRPLLSFLGLDDMAMMKDLCYDTYAKAVLQLLRGLQKAHSAIFILIDAVEFYDSEWEDEVDDFVKRMRKLTKWFNKPENGTSGGVLRVLVTASSWSKRFSSPPRSLVVLDVPEHIDGSVDGFERFT